MNLETATCWGSGDDLFSIFESIEDVPEFPPIDEVVVGSKVNEETPRLVSQNSTSSYSGLQESETGRV
nr:hypothetical protein CFP56_46898 [Quercus suber]